MNLWTLRVPEPEAITADKGGIVKSLYDTRTVEIALPRMIESEIKLASSRKRCLRGRIYQIYNQRVTGTISINTFWHQLGKAGLSWFCHHADSS